MFPPADLYTCPERVNGRVGRANTVITQHAAELRAFERPDWRQRYAIYNEPHHYHNGGNWPFIGGFYVAALVAADRFPKAREALVALTEAAMLTREPRRTFGFNEWLHRRGQFQGDKIGRRGPPPCISTTQRNAFELEGRRSLIVSVWFWEAHDGSEVLISEKIATDWSRVSPHWLRTDPVAYYQLKNVR
ncbi:MAG: hypothetical protein ACI9R3_002211 [Verrucomicrobiales bacterium]|jgi:hypothetical protein